MLWLLRHPAPRFLLAGTVLFLVAGAARPLPVLPALAAPASDEGLLARAALAHGLDRDPVVERRLIRSMAFLDGDGCAPPALYETALDLGLQYSDPVVRRRLAQRMRLALEAAARATEPDDAQLAAYLAAQAERFALPARATVTQVYLSSAQRRGAALADAAQALRARLVAGAPGPHGDPLPIPAVLTAASAEQIAAWLGPAAAEAAFTLPLATWSTPIASPYGLHLLRVEARLPAGPPPLAAIRSAVREAWLEDRAQAAVAAALAAWRRDERGASRGMPGGETRGGRG